MSNDQIAQKVKDVEVAFKELSDICEDKGLTDCNHEDVEFSCMSCSLDICPLLGNWNNQE